MAVYRSKLLLLIEAQNINLGYIFSTEIPLAKYATVKKSC